MSAYTEILTRKALYMCAAHCQGGHSDAGLMAARALGVPFPIRMEQMAEKAKQEGFDPDDLWPWWKRMRDERAAAKLREEIEADD